MASEELEDRVDNAVKVFGLLVDSQIDAGRVKNTLGIAPSLTLDRLLRLRIERRNRRLYARDSNGHLQEVYVCPGETEGEGNKEFLILPHGAVLRDGNAVINPYALGAGFTRRRNVDGRLAEGVEIELGGKKQYEGTSHKVTMTIDAINVDHLYPSGWEQKKVVIFDLSPLSEQPLIGGNVTNTIRFRGNFYRKLGYKGRKHTNCLSHQIIGVPPNLVKETIERFLEEETVFGYKTRVVPITGYHPKDSTFIVPIIFEDGTDNIESYLDRFNLSKVRRIELTRDQEEVFREETIKYVMDFGIDRLIVSSMANPAMVLDLPTLVNRLRAIRGENFELFFSPSNTFRKTVEMIAEANPEFDAHDYFAQLLGLVDVLVFNKEEGMDLGKIILSSKERQSLIANESSVQKLMRFLCSYTRGKQIISTFGDSGIWVYKTTPDTRPGHKGTFDYLVWGGHSTNTVYLTLGAGDVVHGAASIAYDLGLDEQELIGFCSTAAIHKIRGKMPLENLGGVLEIRDEEQRIYADGNCGEMRIFVVTPNVEHKPDGLGRRARSRGGDTLTIPNPPAVFSRELLADISRLPGEREYTTLKLVYKELV